MMSAAKKKASKKDLRITLVKSPIGYSERQKKTVKALGLRRVHQSVEHADNAVIRGMIDKVSHLIEVQDL
jgi:large subunit ribosomal protein L30